MARDDLLFFVRHGVAEAAHSGTDAARGLTAKGRRRFRKFTKLLCQSWRPARIVTSPLVRAVQTAELLARAARLDEVEIHLALVPGPEAADKLVKLARGAQAGTAFVGHEPSLSEAAARLLGLDGPLPFAFKKGGVLALRRASGGAVFEGFRAPKGSERSRLDG